MDSSDDEFGIFDAGELAQVADDVGASDDGAFDTSPRPVKRRRTGRGRVGSPSPRLDMSDESDDSGFDPPAVSAKTSKETKRQALLQDSTSKKKRPLKFRVHEPVEIENHFQEQYVSQLPEIHSSPSRIRGPIWQKPTKVTPPVTSTTGVGMLRGRPSLEFDDSLLDDEICQIHDATARSVRPENSKPVEEKENVAEFEEDVSFPSDAFDLSSSLIDHQHVTGNASARSKSKRTSLAAPLNGLRQTTLFGTATASQQPDSLANKKHNWPLANKEEPPTPHVLDDEALNTWIYPTNLGTIRDYQFNIVHRGLFHNLLVALPTGLGKTFIAATVMLNWFRWTKQAQIVFLAPTKPLVSQQVDACFGIAGIPRSQTTLLTGDISPALRAEEWADKRVFFMTPQTMVNDLKTGICDPKRVVLLVVDEAHRATGGYAYVEVVKFLRRFNQSFRVLALTATPGSTVEGVQEVIDGLDISRVEIRTETSLDIRQYVHNRRIDTRLIDSSMEQQMCMEMFSKALQPVLSQLNQFNAYWLKDPMSLTAFGLTKARQQWAASAGRNAPMWQRGMINSIFSILSSLAHGIELLKYHGIGPFYSHVLAFRKDIEAAKKGSKYAKQINENEHFDKMMARTRIWINHPDFIGHPKLQYLQDSVLNHFMDAGEGRAADPTRPPSATRIMIFAHYRVSVEEIVRVLKRHEPMIRPHVFIGQAGGKGMAGMGQKEQLEIIAKFKKGVYNTLVATSIGEEGLDIGEVDMIICYDSSSSPLRMLQRMGRTGRKRAGNIVLLLMRGKEEQSFMQAKDNYEKMQEMIAAGTRFQFHDDRSPRILPRGIEPVVDKRQVEIPVENSTQSGLPEPKKRMAKAKRPAKKFHMPDGVLTGFVRASRMDASDEEVDQASIRQAPARRKAFPAPAVEETASLPPLNECLLNNVEERELARKYQYVHDGADVVVSAPRLDQHVEQQRSLRPIAFVTHGRVATQHVKTVKRMNRVSGFPKESTTKQPDLSYLESMDDICVSSAASDAEDSPSHNGPTAAKRPRAPPASRSKPAPQKPAPKKVAPKPKKKQQQQQKRQLNPSDEDVNDSALLAAEGLCSSPPATAAEMRLPTQGIDLGTSDTEFGEVDNLDEEEMLDSDLRDFIANDSDEGSLDEEGDVHDLFSSSRPNPVERAGESDGDDGEERDEGLPAVEALAKKAPGFVKASAIVPPNRARARRVIASSDNEDDD